jgi:tetratricopeptide (TPR) repeat protein
MGRVHRALALEYTYSGRPLDEAVAHARQAVTLLERTQDRIWFSQALFALSYCTYYTGDFESSLEAAARLDALGEATGNRRARAESVIGGLSQATRGDWAAGIEACERARALSPDLFETALVLAFLGKAYVEAEDAGRAVPTLEEAIQLADRVRSLQWRQYFRTWLGEAYLLAGRTDQARDVLGPTLGVCREIGYALGIGLAQQVLGRVAHAERALPEAEQRLAEALRTLDAIQARFEAGRTCLFQAALAGARGDRDAAVASLQEAHARFSALGVPRYVERAEALAREAGAALSA